MTFEVNSQQDGVIVGNRNPPSGLARSVLKTTEAKNDADVELAVQVHVEQSVSVNYHRGHSNQDDEDREPGFAWVHDR